MLTFSLKFEDNKALNKFFYSYKKHIVQNGWTITLVKSNDTEKSFLDYKHYNLHNYITKKEISAIFYLSIGVFKTYIKVIDIGLAELGLDIKKNKLTPVTPSMEEIKELILFFISNTIEPIPEKELIQNKDMMIQHDFVKNISDIRMARPIFLKK